MDRYVRSTFAALFLASSVTFAAGAQTIAVPPAVTSPAFAATGRIHIDNFGVINGNYLRGAQPRGKDFADLAGAGVKLVIDLAKEGDEGEAAAATRAGMKFTRIPMTTDRGPSQAEVDQFLALVQNPANQPVYVHCMGGKHRTGVMTAVYRMTTDKWTADQAFKEMKSFHFGADFLHAALKSFVYDFYSTIATRGTASDRNW